MPKRWMGYDVDRERRQARRKEREAYHEGAEDYRTLYEKEKARADRLAKQNKRLNEDVYLLRIGIMGDGEDLSERKRKRLDEIFPN